MKYKYFLVSLFVLSLFISACFFVEARPSSKDPVCPIKQDTNIVFYGETGFGGVGTLSKSWITQFLDWWESQDGSINYVELNSADVKSNCDLDSFPNLEIYIQPGGNAYYQQRKLDSDGRANILNLINSGKAYLGICAGAFYAAGDYYWQGEYYDWPNLLGKYPTVEGSITDIADYDENPGYALTNVNNGNQMIYYGGPTVGWRNTPFISQGEAILTFTEVNNLPAAIKDGNMLLTSIHAEAYENDGITGLTTEQRIENYKWLANSINDVAGTNFYVPPVLNPSECGNNIKEFGEVCDGIDLGTNTCQSFGYDDGTLSCLSDCNLDISTCINYPPQCNDSLDNDGDNLIDYPADLGCDSSEDDDETDYTGPVELLSDGFEDGNLNEWTLSGTGIPWEASTDTSYEGSWAARAKQTGAGEDSFMEITISGSAYNQLTLEYYRKLIGLDAADDFEVSYYDGSWKSVEHLGSGIVSDSSFKFKSFNLPNTTTKIRFKCECGAVSEKCYVDNVRILSQ